MYAIVDNCMRKVFHPSTWFPSPGSALHGELDDGGSADGELIVKRPSLEPKIVTRQKKAAIADMIGVTT